MHIVCVPAERITENIEVVSLPRLVHESEIFCLGS